MYRLLILPFFMCWQLVTAQPTFPFTFSHYSMSTGLMSNEIRSVAQDRTGYLWIASNNGLQRYDGVHFKTFQHRDNNSKTLSQNNVLQILIDKADNLWVLLANGEVGLFDKNKFFYTPVLVQVKQEASLGALKFLIQDLAGNLFYLLHANEVLLYEKKQNAFIPANDFLHLKPEWRITGLAQQPATRKYWLGLLTGGVAIYNQETGKISSPGNNLEHETAVDSLVRFPSMAHFMFDTKGRFWAESWDQAVYPHIVQFDDRRKGKKIQLYEFLSVLKAYNEVHGFAQQEDGSVWVHGAIVLGKFNETENKFDLLPSDSRSGLGIVYDRVSQVYEDRERNVWFATGNNGLYRCNPSQQYFSNILHLNKRTKNPGTGSIMSFAELKNGDVLAGSWGDGLFRYNKEWKEVPLNIRDDHTQGWTSIWGMCASADSNTIWMASQPGIYQYDQAKGTMFFRNPTALQNRTVRQIAEDKHGNLWLGMHHFGLFKWMSPKNGGKDSLLRLPQIGRDLVTKVVADDKGFIWVTTATKGVFAFESETNQIRFHWNNRAEKDSLKIIEGFTSVVLYNDSLVYISSATKLYKFNRQTDQITDLHLSLPLLGSIASIEKDDKGFLWISTENGIYRYYPSQRTMVFFNRDDGVANDRFIAAASHRLKSGRMLFGSDNSFIHFDPAQIKFRGQEQKVVLTSILVGRKELPVDSVANLETLRLAASENSLTIDFSSLTYTAYSVVQYRLEGLDNEWRIADMDNRANFPFLPPGRYRLLLRTLNAEGVPSTPTVLPIFIASPFYQTWWFYTALGIVTAVVLFWLDRQRMKRKEALQRVRTDIAGGLHQEVNTALNNINILSEIARLKSEREPQKAKDYLEQIHTKSHNMMIALDDMLWSLDPENDAMDKTVQRIREYADALTQRHGAVIELLIDKKVEKLQLNMKLRHEAFLLFKEGLRSLMDAGTKNCVVHLTSERGRLLFTIEFENEHCNMQKLNNLLQRRDMEDRLHDLKAKLDVQLHKSRSVFMLQLPL